MTIYSSRNSGSTSEQARQYNERMIIQCVRQNGELPRARLAKLTALSAQTISVITSSLLERQLLRVTGRQYGGRGQPSIKLALNADGAYGIGVNVDRDHISTSLVDFTGSLLHQYHHELLFPSVDQARALIAEDFERLRRELGERWQRVQGIGLAMPRKMGSWLKELGLYGEFEDLELLQARLDGWNQIDFGQQLATLSGLEVVTENDASAAALGELYFGLGHRFTNYFYVYLGMYIGGGIISEGQYFRGAHGNAADFGLFPVVDGTGRPVGLLMREVSLASLYRYLQARGHQVSSLQELQKLQHTDAQPLIDDWVEDAAKMLVAPLFAVMATLDTDAIVFGGRLPPEILKQLLEATRELAAQWALSEQLQAQLVLSETGMNAAAIGAAILPLYETYAPMRERLLVKG